MNKQLLQASLLVFPAVMLLCLGQKARGQTQVQVNEERTGTAVLVDVSASMRFDAPDWRSDIRRSIEKFIAGGRLDESVWRVDGVADEEFIQEVRSGNPVYIPGQPLLVGHIGEIGDTSPFVRSLEVERPASPNDAADFLRNNLPREFDDSWTYLNVTLAVARDTMLAQGAQQWYVVLVSDEDDDLNDSEDPPKEAMRLDSEYGTRVQQEKLIALSHKADSRLRMSIRRVTSRKDPCGDNPSLPLCGGLNPDQENNPEAGQIALMVPKEGKTLEDGSPQFRWKAQGLDRFDLVIRDEEGDVQKRVRVPRRSYTPDDPLSSGNYTWRVTGYGEDGSVQSASYTFKVPGSGAFSTILLILLLLGVTGGVAYLLKQHSGENWWSQNRSKERIDLNT